MANTKKTIGTMTKEEKKAHKAERREAGRARRRQMWQAFQMQRKDDKALIPLMLGAFLGVVILATLLGILAFRTSGWAWWVVLEFSAIMLGAVLALLVFTRRVQRSVYAKAAGQPGAASWVLDQLKGSWRTQATIAATTHLDAVHRVIGRPGVILVGEGNTVRVRPLIAQEKKRLARIVGDTPIYTFIVGQEEDQVPLKKLNRTLMKLPTNIKTNRMDEIEATLASLASRRGAVGAPKGPIPAGAKVRNMQRAARRRSRKK